MPKLSGTTSKCIILKWHTMKAFVKGTLTSYNQVSHQLNLKPTQIKRKKERIFSLFHQSRYIISLFWLCHGQPKFYYPSIIKLIHLAMVVINDYEVVWVWAKADKWLYFHSHIQRKFVSTFVDSKLFSIDPMHRLVRRW